LVCCTEKNLATLALDRQTRVFVFNLFCRLRIFWAGTNLFWPVVVLSVGCWPRSVTRFFRKSNLTQCCHIFLGVHDIKTGKNVPNEYKMNQMVIKYPKSP
jgi:hypothetical protein